MSPIPKEPIDGEVTIEGFPHVDHTLYGIVQFLIPEEAEVTKLWIRTPPENAASHDYVVLQKGDSYTLTSDDLGYLIHFIVKGTGNYTGRLTYTAGPVIQI